jgi:hypothetical protein
MFEKAANTLDFYVGTSITLCFVFLRRYYSEGKIITKQKITVSCFKKRINMYVLTYLLGYVRENVFVYMCVCMYVLCMYYACVCVCVWMLDGWMDGWMDGCTQAYTHPLPPMSVK